MKYLLFAIMLLCGLNAATVDRRLYNINDSLSDIRANLNNNGQAITSENVSTGRPSFVFKDGSGTLYICVTDSGNMAADTLRGKTGRIYIVGQIQGDTVYATYFSGTIALSDSSGGTVRLSGLAGSAYFLSDGTDQMDGDLDVGGNYVTNAGDVQTAVLTLNSSVISDVNDDSSLASASNATISMDGAIKYYVDNHVADSAAAAGDADSLGGQPSSNIPILNSINTFAGASNTFNNTLNINNGTLTSGGPGYINGSFNGNYLRAPKLKYDSLYTWGTFISQSYVGRVTKQCWHVDTVRTKVMIADSAVDNGSPHLYCGFVDSSVTIALNQNDTAQVTNANGNLWTCPESQGFPPITGDTVQVGRAGDYRADGWIRFNAETSTSYRLGIYNVTQDDYAGFYIPITTGSAQATNILAPISIYLEGLAVNDKLIFFITNLTDGDDPVVVAANVIMMYLHNGF